MRPPLAASLARLRSWLFVEGASDEALERAAVSAADVLVQELEDFTPARLRPRARGLAPATLERWRRSAKVACVRVNPLESQGLEDLEAVMPGRPDAVLLPKADNPDHVLALDGAIGELETRLGIAPGHTAIVPNVERARGLMRTHDIARASRRVVACLVASEDMASDLGAERGPDGRELAYVRARFHVECVAAGVLSIDCPYTFDDDAGLEREAREARRLGYTAKSAVDAAQCAIINRVMTPTDTEREQARALVDAFEAAQARGEARAVLEGTLVEWPRYQNAMRLLERAATFDAG